MQKMKMVGSFILVLFISKINILLQHAACILSISDYIRKKKKFYIFFYQLFPQDQTRVFVKNRIACKKKNIIDLLGDTLQNTQRKKIYK